MTLLATLGYEVHAVTGKASRHEFLHSLGASAILTREEAAAGAEKALLKPTWGGAIDTVGGPILFNVIKALRYNASVAACGLVASPELPATVFPFILRGVNLLGVDSVVPPMEKKRELWNRLAGPWRLDLEPLVVPLTLDTLSDAIDTILKGEMAGRGLVNLNG